MIHLLCKSALYHSKGSIHCAKASDLKCVLLSKSCILDLYRNSLEYVIKTGVSQFESLKIFNFVLRL